MKIFNFVTILAIFITVFSCSNKKEASKSSEQNLYDEIMTIHDEAMPRMSEIERHLRTFKKYNTAWPENADSALIKKMPVFVEGLNEASDEMMDWMSNFKTKETWSDTGTYQQYLIKEMENVKWVEISIRTSIEQAESFIRLINEKNNN